MAGGELALLSVVVDDDPRDKEIEQLKLKLRQAERDASDAERAAERAREDAYRALSMLRKQLGPLYRALQAVFGELDAAGIADVEPASTSSPRASDGITGADPRTAAVWASWKDKLGAAGKLIDALLLHKEMNTQQLAIATGLHRTTIPKHIHTLNKAGLLNKNGGRFSLKPLS